MSEDVDEPVVRRAKIHAELLRKGEATVKEIAKASGMTKKEVRQAIRELQTMGIAEKMPNGNLRLRVTCRIE